ncbi:JmjC domain-containing protein 4 [Porphyridium purpureum]|uniref:JmjC domain-containing protein 4 n=1 Tax=Porphyridium purpureum TaxID=35688 RepID=A0A5J4YVT2_PORPP|nr:JmjC domain-containing protein 4 [Porphyridium purpureum]|eukprot:POR9018..scf209_3
MTGLSHTFPTRRGIGSQVSHYKREQGLLKCWTTQMEVQLDRLERMWREVLAHEAWVRGELGASIDEARMWTRAPESRLQCTSFKIKRVSWSELSNAAFWQHCMFANIPVLITMPSDRQENVFLGALAKEWTLEQTPRGQSPNTEPNRYLVNRGSILRSSYAECVVPVKELMPDGEVRELREKVTLREWIERDLWRDPALYLKDWHFIKEHPHADLYTTPPFFREDWLDLYYRELRSYCDDFRFVYWGGKNSITPFHTDVLGSFSWSMNLAGSKHWTMEIPTRQIIHTCDAAETARARDAAPFLSPCEQTFTFLQESNEIVFVPSQWKHTVRNLDSDVLSVNHNWINGANVSFAFAVAEEELTSMESNLAKFGPEVLAGVDAAHMNVLVRACCSMSMDEITVLCLLGILTSLKQIIKLQVNTVAVEKDVSSVLMTASIVRARETLAKCISRFAIYLESEALERLCTRVLSWLENSKLFN